MQEKLKEKLKTKTGKSYVQFAIEESLNDKVIENIRAGGLSCCRFRAAVCFPCAEDSRDHQSTTLRPSQVRAE